MITVRDSIKEDIGVVSKKLRISDINEILKSTGQTPAEALTDGFNAEHCWTMCVDSVAEAMLGIAKYDENKYRPWFLASSKPMEHGREFMKSSIECVDRFKALAPFMENYVDADNKVAVEWLKRIGFQLNPKPVIMGVANVPFYRFGWEK